MKCVCVRTCVCVCDCGVWCPGEVTQAHVGSQGMCVCRQMCTVCNVQVRRGTGGGSVGVRDNPNVQMCVTAMYVWAKVCVWCKEVCMELWNVSNNQGMCVSGVKECVGSKATESTVCGECESNECVSNQPNGRGGPAKCVAQGCVREEVRCVCSV